MRSTLFVVFGALACGAMAQTASFDGMTWDFVTVGQVWPIHWTAGNGTPVSLFLGNTTANSSIFTNRPATSGEFDWTVTLPDGFVPGKYGLALQQSGATDYSSLFSVLLASVSSTTMMTTSSSTPTSRTTLMTTPMTIPMSNATLISASVAATVTVTYWEDKCGCTKTTTVCAATATNLPGTQYTWWDETCGCTKTAMAPASTGAPGCSGSGYGCSNHTAPAGTNMPPPPPASMAIPSWETRYTGEANGRVNLGLTMVGLIAAAMLA
ncbi:uncharacterized protein Z518_05009 [Rhinocladiella mackenziei CBS 650.93]|uniref:Rhinocladiella mackenziei CBS 650.93 unplaced genomic scaffold supercont1.3, whole genome shotgun sequence n=1 Tax=Rhinocladiella mackenziei CBS 650.93 TaxID=1442369 RepID=A0A0D2FXM0_9EURO|nr:uncharacterized protein Z518_05009 [Rhinocladiella mackenziei CBS 650.93]KIX07032.1 hypothetical protein Z518_05009 [Rhinocladiella mackenziei CBS 650.93]